MDFSVCVILTAVLLAAVQADPTAQGPQMFSDSLPGETKQQEKKQQKREPKFETKEVVLYLTPSQIKAYESGKGLMPHEQAVQLRALEEGQGLSLPQQEVQFDSFRSGKEWDQSFESQRPQSPKGTPQYESVEEKNRLELPQQEPQLSLINEQYKDHTQNAFNNAAQEFQKELNKIKNKQKDQMQLQEANKNKLNKDKELQVMEPKNNAPQSPKLELQKRVKYIELPLPTQFLPQQLPHGQEQYSIPNQQYGLPRQQYSLSPQQYGLPTGESNFGQEFVALPSPQLEQQLIPISEPQMEYLPIRNEKSEWRPQNYAYLYFYPHGKPVNNDKLQFFYPTPVEQKTRKLMGQQEQPNFNSHPKFQLVPYEYAYENKLEAQKILKTQLSDYRQLDTHHFESPKLEAHQLEDFDAQQILIQKYLEPHYQQQQQQHEKLHPAEYKYEPQELKLKIIPHTAALLAQREKQIKIDLKDLHVEQQQEITEVYEAQKLKEKLEKEEKEAQRLDAQLKEEEIKAEQFKAEQLRDELFKNQELNQNPFKSHEYKEKPFKNQELFNNQDFKELFKNEDFREQFKNQEFKEELFKLQEFKEETENQDTAKEFLKNQQSKYDQHKSEYPDLAYYQKFEPKKTQMYTLLNPLFQGHSIVESLQEQKSSFPHDKINLETGFKPLQYAPKFNEQKYAREVEKILKRNHIEQQKALAKAAAIANEPPEVIHSEEKVIVKPVRYPLRTPVTVSVPTPVEVKVPQPYTVPVEIIRPYPITITKVEKVEIQKPFPVEIEKHVPVPVTKNVYVKVDKPYLVQKIVPFEVKKEIPVEIPTKNRTPLKLSIIKHVW